MNVATTKSLFTSFNNSSFSTSSTFSVKSSSTTCKSLSTTLVNGVLNNNSISKTNFLKNSNGSTTVTRSVTDFERPKPFFEYQRQHARRKKL